MAAITLSKKAKRLFDRNKLDQVFKDLGEQSGEWYLGRHAENIGGKAPLDKGFARSGERVKDYPEYSEVYKKTRRNKPWLVQSGALLEYVRRSAIVRSWRKGFRIIVPVKPKAKRSAAAYAGIHNNGGPRMPKREYLRWMDTDVNQWRLFATKWLNVHLGHRNFKV
jgi:hypothetical protein